MKEMSFLHFRVFKDLQKSTPEPETVAVDDNPAPPAAPDSLSASQEVGSLQETNPSPQLVATRIDSCELVEGENSNDGAIMIDSDNETAAPTKTDGTSRDSIVAMVTDEAAGGSCARTKDGSNLASKQLSLMQAFMNGRAQENSASESITECVVIDENSCPSIDLMVERGTGGDNNENMDDTLIIDDDVIDLDTEDTRKKADVTTSDVEITGPGCIVVIDSEQSADRKEPTCDAISEKGDETPISGDQASQHKSSSEATADHATEASGSHTCTRETTEQSIVKTTAVRRLEPSPGTESKEYLEGSC